MIALTSERDIGKAFDYGWTSHANTSAGSARVFLPSSRKNLLSSLRTVSTMLHMSSDDVRLMMHLLPRLPTRLSFAIRTAQRRTHACAYYTLELCCQERTHARVWFSDGR